MRQNLSVVLFLSLFLHSGFAAAHDGGIVTAKQVNGTWTNSYSTKARDGLDQELRIWALGNQKLKVQFDGINPYTDRGGAASANIGFAEGIATIDRNVAIFKPNGADPECRMELTFSEAVVVVAEKGCYGLFGLHVHANGKYRKASGKRPTFGQP